MLAWVIGAAWLYLTTGAVFTRFAKLIHMPAFGYGILAALPFAGALLQLPVSYFITRYGHRKPLFIAFGLTHRLLWLPIAFIPWIMPAGWQWSGLIVLFGLSWVFGQMVTPIWVSWMADLVPSRIRGRYFSRRSQLGQLIGIIVTLLMGFALDRAEARSADWLLKIVCGAMGMGAIYGAIDFLFFRNVPDLQRVKPDPTTNLWQMLREPLRDRNFRRFLGFTTTLTFATGYIGQFAWLYLFDVARVSNTMANAMLVFMPLAILMWSGPVWGRVIDRFGRKPVLIIAGLLVIPGALGWLITDREHWVLGYLTIVLSNFVWPGIELSNFNILLGMSDRAKGGAHVAINSTFTAIAGIASGLFGGAIAQWLGDWSATAGGIVLTYHGVLFIISSVLRGLAVLWLIRFEDAKAGTPHEALRYLGTNLYSNIQQTVFIPGRFLQQLNRWTYKIRH